MVTTGLTLIGKYGVTEIAGASPTCTVTYTLMLGQILEAPLHIPLLLQGLGPPRCLVLLTLGNAQLKPEWDAYTRTGF